MSEGLSADRKRDHLELAFEAQVNQRSQHFRFDYEPLFGCHPLDQESAYQQVKNKYQTKLLGKAIPIPLWISSMTGGTSGAGEINHLLAELAAEYQLPIGLGSCRPLLESDKYFDDFNLRPIVGDKNLLFANLGICQCEELMMKGEKVRLLKLIERLKVDGLIVHLNPIQEFLQVEGDRQKKPALETIEWLLSEVGIPLIVKEVGQGFGPRSLRKLCQLPLVGVELAGFGGTNFASLEIMRSGEEQRPYKNWISVGHSVSEMIPVINEIKMEMNKPQLFILSGGMSHPLMAWEAWNRFNRPAVIGMASSFLEHANKGKEALERYFWSLVNSFAMADQFLALKEENNS